MTNHTTGRTRRARELVGLLVGAAIVALLTAGEVEGQGAPNARGSDGAACVAYPDGPEARPIRFAGLEGFAADPMSSAIAADRILTIGRSTFLTHRSPDGTLRQVQDSVLGFVLDLRRRDSLGALQGAPVPMPLAAAPRIIDFPRAIGLGPGHWGAILPLHDSTRDDRSMTGVRAVAYAEYRDGRWSVPESLPVPPAAQLQAGTSSGMLLHAGAVWWAAALHHDRRYPQIALFARRADGWHLELVDHGLASYVQLVPGDGAWPTLVVVQGDDALGIGTNGLVVIERVAEEWRRRVHANRSENLHHVRVAATGGRAGPLIGWRRIVPVEEGAWTAEFAPLAPEDSSTVVRFGRFIADVLPAGSGAATDLWLIRQQLDPVRTEGRVFLVSVDADAVHVRHELPNPSAGRVHPILTDGDLVLLGWTLLQRDGVPVINMTTLRVARCALDPP